MLIQTKGRIVYGFDDPGIEDQYQVNDHMFIFLYVYIPEENGLHRFKAVPRLITTT
jgi:hypothetical protein